MPALALVSLCLLGARPQEPAPADAFRALPAERQHGIVRALERRVLLDPDPAIQAVVSLARDFDSYPIAEPKRFHDPSRWAKGVAPERVLVREGTPEHARVRASIPRLRFLSDLHRAVWYDWGAGAVVRRAAPLRDDEVFENLLNGYPPGSDAAVAHVLAVLDQDRRQRPIAEYLAHLYADLQARVYEDITLYEAWYSGELVDVPDVDAIPFAVEILKTRAYRSPIPPSPKRTELYQRIRDQTHAHRLYRTLREAAAAGFVRAEPDLDPTYQPLVPRFHYLWSLEEESPQRVAAWLGDLPDRAAFLAKMDRAVKDSSEAFARREARQQALAAMAARLRELALLELGR